MQHEELRPEGLPGKGVKGMERVPEERGRARVTKDQRSYLRIETKVCIACVHKVSKHKTEWQSLENVDYFSQLGKEKEGLIQRYSQLSNVFLSF